MEGGHPCAGVEASKVEEKRPITKGPDTTISQEGGMGSSPTAGPMPTGVAFDGLAMVALSLLEEDLELSEDFFIWLHPTNLSEALFMVDDAAE